MRLFVRFRESLARYAEGVHVLGAPASAAALDAVEARVGGKLPPSYRDFLAQWNGALLFHEAVSIYGAAGTLGGLDRIARVAVGVGAPNERVAVGDRATTALAIGETEWGLIRLDGEGRVLAVDAETDRSERVGSTFERWLDATMAREALLYDREGEFRENAFDEGELAPRVARKRAVAGVKADPDAPSWHHELGRLLVEAGDREGAAAALERAVEIDPSLEDAWFALGRLRHLAGDGEGALEAFRGAAAAEHAPEEAAFALAHAARAARSAKLDGEAARIAARVAELDPPFVAEQRAAAVHLIEERDLAGAVERLELASAVAPDDAEVDRLLRFARARERLQPV